MLRTARLFALSFLGWLAAVAGAAAQSSSGLAVQLRQADQVLLVSHDDFGSLIDEHHRPVPVPPYVVNGRPNLKIARKSKVLTPAERARLTAILTRPARSGPRTVMHCCMPHHVLFLVGKQQTAYLDVCLACRCFGDSRNFYQPEFDNHHWEELSSFINKLGLDYDGF